MLLFSSVDGAAILEAVDSQGGTRSLVPVDVVPAPPAGATFRLIASGSVAVAAFGAAILGPFSRVAGEVVEVWTFVNNLGAGDEHTWGPNAIPVVTKRIRNDGVADPNLQCNFTIGNGTGGNRTTEYKVVGVTLP